MDKWLGPIQNYFITLWLTLQPLKFTIGYHTTGIKDNAWNTRTGFLKLSNGKRPETLHFERSLSTRMGILSVTGRELQAMSDPQCQRLFINRAISAYFLATINS